MTFHLIGIISLSWSVSDCLSGGFILLCSIFHFPCLKKGLKLWTLNLIIFHIDQLTSHLCSSHKYFWGYCVASCCARVWGTVPASWSLYSKVGTGRVGGNRHQTTDFKLHCDRCFERYPCGSQRIWWGNWTSLGQPGRCSPETPCRLPSSERWVKVSYAEDW